MQRSKPLARRTPLRSDYVLKQSGELKRGTVPLKQTRLNPVGQRARREAPQKADAKRVVMERAGCVLLPDGTWSPGRCEAPGCGRIDNLQWHHAFKRGFLAGIDKELCDDPRTQLAICWDCHRRCDNDGDLKLRDAMRWVCVARICAGRPVAGNETNPLYALRNFLRTGASLLR